MRCGHCDSRIPYNRLFGHYMNSPLTCPVCQTKHQTTMPDWSYKLLVFVNFSCMALVILPGILDEFLGIDLSYVDILPFILLWILIVYGVTKYLTRFVHLELVPGTGKALSDLPQCVVCRRYFNYSETYIYRMLSHAKCTHCKTKYKIVMPRWFEKLWAYSTLLFFIAFVVIFALLDNPGQFNLGAIWVLYSILYVGCYLWAERYVLKHGTFNPLDTRLAERPEEQEAQSPPPLP